MSDKKVSGINTALSPDEFAAKMNISKGETKGTKIKKFFSNLAENLSSLGLFPVLSSSSKSSGRREHHGGDYSAPQQPSSTSFRESYQFDPEKAYVQRMQEKAYFEMVDGKGDPKHCDCDHDGR